MKEINEADKKNLKLFKVFTIFKFFIHPHHHTLTRPFF